MKTIKILTQRLKLMLSFFLLLISVDAARATNYYVSNSGSNSNSGTSIGNAWQTLQYAYTTWPAIAGHNYFAGDTLFIDSGTYLGININDAICYINNIVITAYDTNHKPTLQANLGYCVLFSEYKEDTSLLHHYNIHDITIQSLIMDASNFAGSYGIKLFGDSVHNIRIIDCEIKGAFSSGIATSAPAGVNFVSTHSNLYKGLIVHDNGGTNVGNHGFYLCSYFDTVENCLVYYNSGNGIKIGTTLCNTLTASNIVIRNNICCFNGIKSGGPRAGIAVTGCDSGLVYNNLCYDNVVGILLNVGADNIKVFNNTCYNNILYGIWLASDPCGSTGHSPCINDSIVNNILYKNSDTATDHNGMSIDPLDVPLFVSSNDSGKNNESPGFYDEGAGNFTLTSGSYALASGYNLPVVPDDIYGNARPAIGNYDLGAIENSLSTALIRSKFYVDSAIGNDLNPGTEAAPYKSFVRGMSELFPGDSLVAGNGSYIDYYSTYIPYGTPSAPIVLMANAGTTPVIRTSKFLYSSVFPVFYSFRSTGTLPQYITINGLTFDAQDYPDSIMGSPFSVDTKGITVNNCTFRNPNRMYIDIYSGAKSVHFNNCQFQRSNARSFGGTRVYADSAVFNNCTWFGNDSGDNIYAIGRWEKYDGCTIFGATGNGITLGNNLGSNAQVDEISNSKICSNGANGIRINDTNSISRVNNLVINDSIYLNDSSGIFVTGRTDTIRQNKICKNKLHGIYGSHFQHSDIEQNFIDSNSVNGIYLDNCDTLTVYNNLVYGDTADGIAMVNTDSLKLYNNTIANNNDTGVTADVGCSRLDLVNNIIYGNTIADTAFRSPLSFIASWLTLSGNPEFVGAGDYRLRHSSSCINAGATLSMVTTDIVGTPRPQNGLYDMGAYETISHYYVSTHGSDANSGLTLATAFRHINYTLTTAAYIYKFLPGDTVLIDTGTYNEHVSINNTACYIDSTVIIAYDTSHKPVIQPTDSSNNLIDLEQTSYSGPDNSIMNIIWAYLVLDGTANGVNTTWNGIELNGGSVHDNIFTNCEVRYCSASGIQAMGGSHNNVWKSLHVHHNGVSKANVGIYIISNNDIVENCFTDHNSGAGIHVGTTGTSYQGNNVVICNNISCFNAIANDAAGIAIWDVDSGVIAYNNICYGNYLGIQLFDHANRVRVYNNTCYNNYNAGLSVMAYTYPSSYDTVENNLLFKNGDTANGFNGFVVDAPSLATMDSSHNISNVVNPLFYDRGAADFKLCMGSFAIADGLNIHAVTTDFYGVPRPISGNYNLGAIEGTVLPGTTRHAFYVDSATGNDFNAGTATAPYQNFNRGMSELFPGDSVVLGSGSYIDNYYTYIPYGMPGSPIVLMANAGATPVIRANHFLSPFVFPVEYGFRGITPPHDITIDGLTFDAQDYKGSTLGCGLSIYNKNVTVKNSVIKNPNRYYVDVYSSARNAKFINCSFYKSNSSSFGTIRVYADSCVFKHDIFSGNDSGDNVYVIGRWGKYDSCTIYNAAGNGITFGSYLTSNAVVNTLSNSTIYSNAKNGVKVTVNNCNIIGDTIYNNDSSGIYIGSLTDTIKGNVITKNWLHGIYGNGLKHSDIERNFIDSNSVSGIYLNSSDTLTIYNNVVYGDTVNGITMSNTDSAKIYNNTIADNNDTGIVAYPGSSNLDLINNIVYNNILADTAFYGCAYSFTFGYLTPSGSPMFVGGGNYALQSGSPCINTGKSLSMIPVDIIGTTRPKGIGYDKGAYENILGFKFAYATPQSVGENDVIKIYPVPFNNRLNIDYENLQKGNLDIALYNAAGTLVSHYSYMNITAGKQLFVINAKAGWSNGLYTLFLINNGQTYSCELILQH